MRTSILLITFLTALGNPGIVSANPDTLVVGYTTAPPFIMENEGRLSGLNIWLWETVSSDLNLPYKYQKMDFKSMLQSLEEGSIDVSINPLTITSERSKTLEFTHSFYASNATVAMAEISAFQKLVNFIRGFFNSHFIKGFSILFIIILIFGIAGWYFEKKANPMHFRKGFRGLWDGIWWSVVTLTTVGYGDKSPQTNKGKLTALLLMFTGMLFISGLTASIASSLTVKHLSGSNESIDDFKPKKVGTVRNTGTEVYLRDNLFKNIQLYDDVPQGLMALKNDRIEAFLYDEPLLNYRIKADSTFVGINILPLKFDLQFYAFGLPKDRVELEQQLSQKILEIVESYRWHVMLNEYGLSEF